MGVAVDEKRADAPQKVPPASQQVPPFLQRPAERKGDRGFREWMKGAFVPGHVMVAVGVMFDVTVDDQRAWNSFVIRPTGKPLPKRDLSAAAALCQALSSEVRLAILNELALGDRSTSELMEAAGLDRGQLYHHLRDLFVQGLVEQPERGRYSATMRGRMALFAACVLPNAGDPADRARALELGGSEDESSGGD